MQADNLAEYYIEKLIYIENNTNIVQRKVAFPNNSISLMFQPEKRIKKDLKVIRKINILSMQ